jgi:magnesium chelatase family protein
MRYVTLPARFLLACATNPCPCGYEGDERRECRCTPLQKQNYIGRLSGPLTDRLDLFVRLSAVPVNHLHDACPAERSGAVRDRVLAARRLQQARHPLRSPPGAGAGVESRLNAHLSGGALRRHAWPDDEGVALLERAMMRLQLSARAHDRVLRVARTIADLEGTEAVGVPHVAEALQFR